MTFTISGDVATLLGADHTTGDPVALWVECSQPVMVVGATGLLGGRLRATVASDGTFSVAGLPASVGDLPLYRLVVDSRSLRLAGNPRGLTTNWFPLTANRDLTWIVANYVTVTVITAATATNVAAAAALGATNDTATASYVNNSASATTAALKAALAPDVIFVGAGIDPTGVADSTTAIQAMITANPGRRLRFPVGVFKFSTLTLTDGQSLVGSGWQDYRDRHVFFGNASWNNAASFHGTILRSTATTGVAITIFDNEVNTGSLAEFFLIGPGSGTSTGILLGGTIVTESVVHPVWHNVKVGNFFVGVKMQWVNEGGFHDLTIHGCETGLLFGDYVNQNAFYMLDLQRCDTALLMNNTCAANTFYSPIAQVCGTGFVVSGQKTTLVNPYVEGTTTEGGGIGNWGIDIAGGVGNTVIAPLLSSATDGLRIRAGANDCTVTAFGYDGNSAPLSNAGARAYLQGYFTGLLTDTGTSTTIIDAAYDGTAFAPRKAWTPTFDAAYGGTFAVGNGTVTGRYSLVGKNVTGHVEFTKGSTSVMAGQIRLLLPVNAIAISSIASKVTMLMANGNFVGNSLSDAVSNVIIGAVGTGGASANLVAASVPAFWTTGDKITVQFTYEIA